MLTTLRSSLEKAKNGFKVSGILESETSSWGTGGHLSLNAISMPKNDKLS